MIRQAHTYLAGAVSGTALIAAAVVAFVLLVSLQALREWPLAGIGGGGDSSAVSTGGSAQGGDATQGAATGTAGATTPAGANGNGRHPHRGGQQDGHIAQGTSPSPGSPASEAPASSPAAGGGTAGSTPSAPANAGGSGSSPPKGGSSSAGSGRSTAGAVTGAVNNTVSGGNETLGGTLGETGVTKATEEFVNGVAGPESPVGKTLEKTVEAVGGLLGGHH